MRESRSRYSTVSILLHWTIFVLIFANATVGGWMEDASGPDKLDQYALHKSIGITVLALSMVRLGWRIAHPFPPFPDRTPIWQRIAARATHIVFYLLMIGIPLLGWAAASAGGAPETPLYGAIPAPNLPVGGGEATAETLGGLHKAMVKAIYVLLGLHVLGALKHYLIDRDAVLPSMLPIIPMRRRK